MHMRFLIRGKSRAAAVEAQICLVQEKERGEKRYKMQRKFCLTQDRQGGGRNEPGIC